MNSEPARPWEHDLFISYAHVDDRRPFEVQLGWVSAFVGELRRRLEQEGQSGVRIWFDNEALRGPHEVTLEISRRIRGSALLLAVVSPGYLQSRWCREELKLFFESRAGFPPRVFLVEKTPATRPPELKNFISYNFYYPDEQGRARTWGDPQPVPEEKKYFHLVQDLARDLARELDLVRSRPWPARSEPRDRVGPYQLGERIGAGPYRLVYRAVRADREGGAVALALPHDQREDVRARQSEAFQLLASKLRHPGLVPIVDIGEDRERLYVVYELAEGVPLARRLEERPGPWPLEESRALLERIGEVVGAAHAEGVFHGQFSPAEVLLKEEGEVQLLDFGLFDILQRSGLRFGWKPGSEPYVSPEQWVSRTPLYEASADLWAFAALARRLFVGSPPPGLGGALAEADPVPPDAGLPEEIARFLRRALARSARDRFAIVKEMLAALRTGRQRRSPVGGFDPDLEMMLEVPRPGLFFVQTEDPVETVERLRAIAVRMGLDFRVWSFTSGLTRDLAAETSEGHRFEPLGVLDWLARRDEATMLVLLDYDPYADDWPLTLGSEPMREMNFGGGSSERRALALGSTYLPWTDEKETAPLFPKEPVVRFLREWASGQVPASILHKLLLMGPGFVVPADLERFVHIHTARPADPAAVEILLHEVWQEVDPKAAATRKSPPWFQVYALHAAGLPAATLRNSLRLGTLRRGGLTDDCLEDLRHEKEQIVHKGGLLELLSPLVSFGEQVVGFDLLQNWVESRALGLRNPVMTGFLAPPRGVLLGGLPGSGKSLCAQAVAGALRWPLLRFDPGRSFTAALGGTEANIRSALALAEALSPAVLWVDDFDRAFGSRGAGDVTARVLQTLLTWLQERDNLVFLVTTATDDQQVPAELMRAGRFEAVFFLDWPEEEERAELLRHVLAQHGRRTEEHDFEALAQKTALSSRAELVGGLEAALFAAAANGRLNPTPGELVAAVAAGESARQERARSLAEIRERWLTFAWPASSTRRPTLFKP